MAATSLISAAHLCSDGLMLIIFLTGDTYVIPNKLIPQTSSLRYSNEIPSAVIVTAHDYHLILIRKLG